MRSHVLSNILHKVSSVVSPVIIWEPLKLFFRDLFSNAIKEERRKRKKNFESTWNRRNRGKESECFSGHNSFMVHRNRVESRVPSKMSERRRAKGKREQFESKNFDGPEQWRLSCSVSSGIKKLRNYSRLGRFKTRGLSRFIWIWVKNFEKGWRKIERAWRLRGGLLETARRIEQ